MKAKLLFHKLTRFVATRFMRGNTYTVRLVQVSNGKKDLDVISKRMEESDLTRRMHENDLLKVKDLALVNFSGFMKPVANYVEDIIYVDFNPSTSKIIRDTKFIFLEEKTNKVYRVKRNGKVVDQKNEIVAASIEEFELQGKYFIPIYNSNSGASADRYMGFAVNPRNTKDSWVSEISEILGLRPPKNMNFKKFVKYIGRLFQSATHSMPAGEDAKAFIIVMGQIAKMSNKITGKKGNIFNGYMQVADIEAIKIGQKMLPGMAFKQVNERIMVTNPKTGKEREMVGRPVAACRWIGTKGVAGPLGKNMLKWYAKHFKILKIKRDNPLAQELLDYWFEHQKMMPGFEDVQMIHFYTDTEKDPVSFLADMDIVKSNFDIQKDNVMNILSFAHACTKGEIRASRQFTDKWTTCHEEIMHLFINAIIREIWRDTKRMFGKDAPEDEDKEKSIKSSYFADQLRILNKNAFIKDGGMYKNTFRNQLKKYSNIVSKRNPLIAGTYQLIIPDPSKLIALVEGKTPILTGSKICAVDARSGKCGCQIKYPTGVQSEYTLSEMMSIQDYKKALKQSDISSLGKLAILDTINQLPPGVLMINSTLEYMTSMAGLDYDGDKIMIYCLPENWKKEEKFVAKNSTQKKDTIVISSKTFKDDQEKPTVCYTYYNNKMHKFNVEYSDEVSQLDVILPEGEAIDETTILLEFVPTQKEVYEGKIYNAETDSYDDITIDFTELEGQILLAISEIDQQRGKAYLYVKDEEKDELPSEFEKDESQKPSRFKTVRFMLEPLSMWAETSSLIKFNRIRVSDFADSNTKICQAARELFLSQFHKATRGFEGISPVFEAISKLGGLLRGNKDAENFKGLTKKVVPAAKEQGWNKVIITSRQEAFEAFKRAKKARFSFRSFKELFELFQAIHFFGTDDVIGSKKTATQIEYSEEWRQSITQLKMGSMMGMEFKLEPNAKRDRVVAIYGIDTYNKNVEKKNREQIYQIPYAVEDEGMIHMRYLGNVISCMLQTYMPNNNFFENIADDYYDDLDNIPVSIVVFGKEMYYMTIGMGRMDQDNNDMQEGQDENAEDKVYGELKQDVDEHLRNARRIVKCAIGNTIIKCFQIAGCTEMDAAVSVKYFSDKSVSKINDMFGVKTNPTSFGSVCEGPIAKMFLKILTGKETYEYWQKLTPFVTEPCDLEASVEVKNGIVENEYFVDLEDGTYETKCEQVELDENKNINEYSVKCTLKTTENSDITDCYCLYSIKKNAQENLINAQNKLVHVAATCDEKHFKACVVDEDGNVVTELPEPYWASQWDKEVFVKFLNTLRNCRINTVYKDKAKCLFTLSVDTENEVTKEQEEEIVSVFSPARRKEILKAKAEKANKVQSEEELNAQLAQQVVDANAENDRVETDDEERNFDDYADYDEAYDDSDDEFLGDNW